MSEHTSDENGTQHTTQPTVDDVLELNYGDAIAVRAKHEDIERIVAGQISTEPASRSEINEQLDEIDSAGVIGIDADLWWDIEGDKIEEKSHWLEDRPQYQPYVGEPLRDAPSCSLACRDDGSVILIIPAPIYRGSRISYYAPDPCGTVVEFDSGALVTPKDLVPEGYDSIP